MSFVWVITSFSPVWMAGIHVFTYMLCCVCLFVCLLFPFSAKTSSMSRMSHSFHTPPGPKPGEHQSLTSVSHWCLCFHGNRVIIQINTCHVALKRHTMSVSSHLFNGLLLWKVFSNLFVAIGRHWCFLVFLFLVLLQSSRSSIIPLYPFQDIPQLLICEYSPFRFSWLYHLRSPHLFLFDSSFSGRFIHHSAFYRT